MNKRTAQRGLSMMGFLFVAAVVVAVVMIGFRTVPSYIEYFTVKKVMQKTLQDEPDPFSLTKFRSDFDLKASADYIDSVRGSRHRRDQGRQRAGGDGDMDQQAAHGWQCERGARLRGYRHQVMPRG